MNKKKLQVNVCDSIKQVNVARMSFFTRNQQIYISVENFNTSVDNFLG